MTIGSELFEMAERYLSSSVGLDTLDTWLADHAQELAQLEDSDPMARLSGLLQVMLAEMDDAVTAEQDLRSQMVDFFNAYVQMFRPRTDSAAERAEFFGEDFTLSSTGQSLQPVEYTAA